LVEKAHDYCTKAVSLYQGLEQYTELTLEWCDILVDVLEVSRQHDLSMGQESPRNNVIHNFGYVQWSGGSGRCSRIVKVIGML